MHAGNPISQSAAAAHIKLYIVFSQSENMKSLFEYSMVLRSDSSVTEHNQIRSVNTIVADGSLLTWTGAKHSTLSDASGHRDVEICMNVRKF